MEIIAFNKFFKCESHHWYSLQSHPHPKPSPRVGHSIICDTEEKLLHLFLIGGANPSGLTQDIYMLNLETLKWTEIQTNGFSFRYEHCAFESKVQDHQCICIFGGADSLANRNDVQIYNKDTKMWKTLKTKGKGPSPRTQHCCAIVDGLLIVFGGGHIGADPVPDRSVYTYDPKSCSWTTIKMSGQSPSARQGHVMATVSSKVYIHGGMSGQEFYDDLYTLDLQNYLWNELNPLGSKPSPRAAHAAVAVEKDIYIFGGLGKERALNDMYCLNTENNHWRKIELNSVPSPRLDFAICVVKSAEILSKESNFSCVNDIETERKSTRHEDAVLIDSSSVPERYFIIIHGGMDNLGNIYDDSYVYVI